MASPPKQPVEPVEMSGEAARAAAGAGDGPGRAGAGEGDGAGAARASASQEEVALLTRVAAGDRAALAAIYGRFAAKLGRYIGRVVGRPEAVGEVVNDVMLAVWQGAGRYDPSLARPSTWLYGIAHNKALKALGRHARVRELPLPEREDGAPEAEAAGGGATPEQAAMSRQLGQSLQRAMGRLSPDHRAVLELAFGEDLSYQEIAEITECPVNTVKTRVFHARRRLAELLERAAAGSRGAEEREA